jgi:hypothetical protein
LHGITETNRIHLVLFGMQYRTFGPDLAAIYKILISFVWDSCPFGDATAVVWAFGSCNGLPQSIAFSGGFPQHDALPHMTNDLQKHHCCDGCCLICSQASHCNLLMPRPQPFQQTARATLLLQQEERELQQRQQQLRPPQAAATRRPGQTFAWPPPQRAKRSQGPSSSGSKMHAGSASPPPQRSKQSQGPSSR